MARKITMFELHFDGAQFGPASVGTPSEQETTATVEETPVDDDSQERAGRPSVRRLVLASIGLSLAVSLLARRLARRFEGDETDGEITIEEVDAVEEPPLQ